MYQKREYYTKLPFSYRKSKYDDTKKIMFKRFKRTKVAYYLTQLLLAKDKMT